MFDPQKTKIANTLEFGAEIGVISKSGTWYSYKETRIGQGVVNSINYLVENPGLFTEIELEVRENMFKPIVKLAPDML